MVTRRTADLQMAHANNKTRLIIFRLTLLLNDLQVHLNALTIE